MKKILAFILLAYTISWIIWLPLYDDKLGFSLPWQPLTLQHGIGGLGPLIAGFLVSLFSGKNSYKQWYEGFLKLPFKPMLAALALPFLFLFLIMIVIGEKDYTLIFSNREFLDWNYGFIILYNFIFFGLGEEGGWSGILRKHFDKKFAYPYRIIIISLIWAVWHWPLFLYRPGYDEMGFLGIFGWCVSLITGAVILQYLYDCSKESTLICAIFHCTIDLVFTANFTNNLISNGLGMIITILGIFIFGIEYRKWKISQTNPKPN